MSRLTSLGLVLVAGAVLIAGCAQPAPYRSYDAPPMRNERVEFGIVDSIEMYEGGQPHSPVNLGSIIGGVAGGVIGHQIGSGRGNTAATIAGAVGGALVGNEIDKNQQQPDRYRVVVRLDSGGTLAVTEVGEGELRVGDRVRIVDNRVYRT